jgi:hypothetical protein
MKQLLNKFDEGAITGSVTKTQQSVSSNPKWHTTTRYVFFVGPGACHALRSSSSRSTSHPQSSA